MPPIDPVAFQIGPLAVRWYGILLTSGMLAGVVLAMREARRLGQDPDFVANLALVVLPAAIIGARLYYVAFNPKYYLAHPAEIFAIWHGGLAIHGGVIAGVLAGGLFARYYKAKFWFWVDVVAPSIIIGQAIGRWGNFINQEAHGGPAPQWLMDLLPAFIRDQMLIGGVYYHPTFLYESLWNFAVLALLLWLRRQQPRQGEVFFTYVIAYSVGRFFIEGMRTDSLMLGDLRGAQVISLVLIVGAVALMLWRRRAGQAQARYGEH